MKKKKGIRRAVPWIILGVIALILGMLPQLARKAAAGTEASVLTARAETGEIENTLAGGGTLTAEDPVQGGALQSAVLSHTGYRDFSFIDISDKEIMKTCHVGEYSFHLTLCHYKKSTEKRIKMQMIPGKTGAS